MSALVLAYPACSSNPTAENKTETPRPTTTAVLTTDVLRLAESPRLGTGPEVTMTVDSDMALALEEPQPTQSRWVLIYTPPFLSSVSANFLPQGDEFDPRPRSVFVFSPIKSGRGEVEFARLPLESNKDPLPTVRVTISAS